MTTPDRLLFIRTVSGLKPGDDRAAELLRRWKVGKGIAIPKRHIVGLRSPEQLALWWTLMGVIWNNQERYATKEDVSDQYKIWLGHYHEFTDWRGKPIARPKSIAFGNLPPDEFNQLMDGAIRLTREWIMPNTTHEELRAELASLIGVESETAV